MAGLKSNEVRLEAYDAAWPEIFGREAAVLRGALGALANEVEHIGSTAVSGMAAKPVVDIAVQTKSFANLSAIIAAMERAGYSYKGEFGLPGRQFFTKGDPVLFHVHIVEPDCEHWPKWIRFRDALRADAKLRDGYAVLKRGLAEKFGHDRPAYTAGKGGFIRRVLEKSA